MASCARERLERNIVPTSYPQPPLAKKTKRGYPFGLFGSTARSRVAIVVNGDAAAGFHAAGFACFASCSNSFSSFASALYRVYMMAQMMAWPTAKMPATNAISAGVSTQPAA